MTRNMIHKYDYYFKKSNNLFQGFLLLFTTFQNWKDSFSQTNFSTTDSRGFFNVTKQNLKREEF